MEELSIPRIIKFLLLISIAYLKLEVSDIKDMT